ncbi:hypothetical protein ACFRAM_16340 [Paenibacillus sp. NPDC056722]|uniref:hypothetical protein n=1 Tax=Paenibacillus sp. NPDC056722 TaxID=3345924 RepID=UPI00368CF8D6
MSILNLTIIGIAGFMCYKYAKRMPSLGYSFFIGKLASPSSALFQRFRKEMISDEIINE